MASHPLSPPRPLLSIVPTNEAPSQILAYHPCPKSHMPIRATKLYLTPGVPWTVTPFLDPVSFPKALLLVPRAQLTPPACSLEAWGPLARAF